MSAFANLVREAREAGQRDNALPDDRQVTDSPLPDAAFNLNQPSSSAARTPPVSRPPSRSGPTQSPPNPRKSSHYTLTRNVQPGTPAARTGPPGSLDMTYVRSASSRPTSTYVNGNLDAWSPDGREASPIAEEVRPRFQSQDSQFRGALEYANSEQREYERRELEKRNRKRESRLVDGEYVWNPIKWFADSPRDEKEGFQWNNALKDKGKEKASDDGPEAPEDQNADGHAHSPSSPIQRDLPPPIETSRSHQTLPPTRRQGSTRPAPPKWNRLRSLLPTLASQGRGNQSQTPGPSAVIPQEVNITDELMAGGLSTIMLRLWFERDEKGLRRVPVLLHRLRLRIADSLYPLSGHKAVFRIECEYANGAARWVVYRTLRDFISIHTHYTVSNAYNRNVENMPDFPATSIPYLKWLKRENRDRHVGHHEFARLQRENLENYLLGLIRVVMFHPTSNRLSGFLEISALSIALAQAGGAQFKAGFLRIEQSGSKGGGFGRRSTNWRDRKQQKWCAVRESYLVVMEEQGELTVWDVFLLDQDFKIERPTRYYRAGLNLLHGDAEQFDTLGVGADNRMHEAAVAAGERHSFSGTIKHSIRKAGKKLHLGRHQAASQPAALNGGARADGGTSGDDSSSSSSDSDESSAQRHEHERAQSPMLDPSTNTNPLAGEDHDEVEVGQAGAHPNDAAKNKSKKKRRTNEVSKHTFYIENSQMRLKLFARNERQMLQWIAALEKVAATSHFTGTNRFDSFAPIRLNVAAQWLVDGRDYFWNLSRAILLAKETIYIHDWWLSPELQMRRPGKQQYRLDKLLQRKAREGVKVHVILYQEVSSRTTPTDSNYAKQRLTALHPNVMVQRSPSHFQTGTFYWAHHEKMCVIDEAIAFMGGLDLCFGRWDTAQHILVDDPESGPEPSETIWPGKDYSNPRVKDFYALNQPEEDMYDRGKVPRMPWHDVAMQIVGQPARDLARHFVQRWNYLLRIKNHSKTMPFLLPPPEFQPADLTRLGLTGTCELQICRSAGPWSLGTPARIEHSIQNAYLKAIQLSEHFVYIENQFFITSTMVGDVKVENKIGDALVHRIIRAHRQGTKWKCCIVIPLLPGFTFPVDHSDASAIRIILECQNRTICRGPNSIYGRLRKEGIDPDEYISVFCLRNWAKLRGDILTTEQVYIHGKVCIVDDRLVIMGSANINERSMRGDRDSELAAVIRDTDMIDGTMAGGPFKVGRFAHTLRVRLMREHIGVDVDAMYQEDLLAREPVKQEHEQEEWDPDTQQEHGKESGVTHVASGSRRTAMRSIAHDVLEGAGEAIHGSEDVGSKDARLLLHKHGLKHGNMDATAGDQALKDERTTFNRRGEKEPGFASAQVPTLEEKTVEEKSELMNGDADGTQHGRTADGTELYGAPADAGKDDVAPPSGDNDASKQEQDAPNTRSILRKHLTAGLRSGPWTLPTPAPKIDPHGFDDPVCDEFWKDVWVASAVHNTEIYRKVFHAVPDDLVTTWKQYKEFIAHHERLNKPVKEDEPAAEPAVARMPSETADSGAPGRGATVAEQNQDPEGHTVEKPEAGADQPADAGTPGSSEGKEKESLHPADHAKQPSVTPAEPEGKEREKEKRRYAKGDEPFEKWEREEMETLLEELCGHLVLYPTRFLEGEDIANNFLFNADRLLPMPIYD